VAKGGLLRRGNQGPGVAKVQAALGIAPDGIFGGGTEAAVKAFQADHGLTPDGLVGPMTKGALGGGSGEVATTGNVPAGGTGAVGGAGGSGGVKGSGGGASGEFAFGGATGGDSTVKGVPIDGIEPAPGAEDEKLG
jgi:peptidoglycan hydrolase-like protein with peptidoglycan-binding domain